MTHSLRERRRQQLHDEVMDATRALMEIHGYAALVMEDVAARAGISKPTLYAHFASKDALVAATLVRELSRLQQLTEPSESAGTPLQRLARVLETVMGLQLKDQRDSLRMWVPEFHKLSCESPELRQAMISLDTRIGSLIREAMSLGEIDPALDPPMVARVFYALVATARFVPHGALGEPSADSPRTIATIFARGVRPVTQPE